MRIVNKTLLYSAKEIQSRVAEIAAEINAEYAGKDLVVVCVLKGGLMFFSDLVKQLTGEPRLDFVRLASYGQGAESSGAINFTKDIEISLKGAHVLVVEDIVDTGLTLNNLLAVLWARNPQSLHVCSLLNKPSRRQVEVKVDFSGFEIEDEFVVGYGLDFAGSYRHLPFVGVLKPEVYENKE